MEIHKRMQEWRFILGFTSSLVAEKIGISEQYLMELEACAESTPLSIGLDVSSLYGIPIDLIYFG